MTDFPENGTFSQDDTLEDGEKRLALEDLLRAGKELPGAGARQSLPIVSGEITPASGSGGIVLVTPESGSVDDLLRILQTNTRDNAVLYLRIAQASHKITLKTGGTSPGNLLLLYGDTDYLLSDVSQVSCFERQGSSWQEILRSGIEDPHIVGSGAPEPPYGSGWSAGGLFGEQSLRFYRDADRVQLHGVATGPADLATPIVFTLPVGYRPTWRRRFSVIFDNVYGGPPSQDEAKSLLVCTIFSDGQVQIAQFVSIAGPITTAPAVVSVVFDGVSFSNIA